MGIYEDRGLLAAFKTFDKHASFEQREAMDVLRKELKSLGRNPLANVRDRFDIARRIVGLRAVAGATITGDMEY